MSKNAEVESEVHGFSHRWKVVVSTMRVRALRAGAAIGAFVTTLSLSKNREGMELWVDTEPASVYALASDDRDTWDETLKRYNLPTLEAARPFLNNSRVPVWTSLRDNVMMYLMGRTSGDSDGVLKAMVRTEGVKQDRDATSETLLVVDSEDDDAPTYVWAPVLRRQKNAADAFVYEVQGDRRHIRMDIQWPEGAVGEDVMERHFASDDLAREVWTSNQRLLLSGALKFVYMTETHHYMGLVVNGGRFAVVVVPLV
jgi:hypothetical protein